MKCGANNIAEPTLKELNLKYSTLSELLGFVRFP
jgi:hypothetical protein